MTFQPSFNALSNKLYQLEVNAWLLSCNFVVDVANGNGLGLRSLKGAGIANIFMNSTASFTGDTHTNLVIDNISPATSSWAVVGMPIQGSGIPVGAKIASITSATAITISAAATTTVGSGTITYQGVGSPNPEAGVIMVQLGNNYNKYLGGFSGFVSKLDGSSQTSTTAGRASVITALGTATLAQWIARGFPVGMTPAVGACFIATTTGTIGGSAAVQRPLPSGIASMEVCGDPNQTLRNSNVYVNGGGIIIIETLAASFAGSALANHTHTLNLKNAAVSDGATTRVNAGTNLLGANTGSDIAIAGAGANGGIANASAGTPAGTMSMVRTAPLDSSVCSLSFYLSNSSVTVNGQ